MKFRDLRPDLDWSLMPGHMVDGFELYIDHGILPGSFGTAVLENDLSGALGRADYINKHRLHDIVSWFHMYAPSGCWGSREKVEEWMRRGGLIGITSTAPPTPASTESGQILSDPPAE